MDIKRIIEELTLVSGVSGSEEHAHSVALSYLKKYIPDAYITQGGVVGTINKELKDKKHILLDAHIDQIGFIVTYITFDGFIKFSNCGGIDARLLSAQQVVIHGKEDIIGVIISTPPHLSKGEEKVAEVTDLYIDTGYSKEKLSEIVHLGDKITFVASYNELIGGRITATSLDDRVGVAAILYALELLQKDNLDYAVSVLFSNQEEIGERGAKIASFELNPDIALAVDVSFAYTGLEDKEKCGIMGKGCMVGLAPSLDRELCEKIMDTAEKSGIPYQVEVMSGTTGTNADQFSVNRSGVKASTLSIPLKYMHTPVEVIDIEDVKNTGILIAEYLRSVK